MNFSIGTSEDHVMKETFNCSLHRTYNTLFPSSSHAHKTAFAIYSMLFFCVTSKSCFQLQLAKYLEIPPIYYKYNIKTFS